MPKVYLPKTSERKEVREALNYHYDSQTPELHRKAIIWEFTHWFLQGMRNIPLRGILGGLREVVSPVDYKGRKRVKFEEALVQTVVEVGRLIGIDWEPAVQRTPGFGLSTLRGESLSQAILSHLWRVSGSEQFKISASMKLATYGGCGFLVEKPQMAPRNRWEPTVSIVPMWELRPLPACPLGVDEVGGITWSRWVPYEWLKTQLKSMRVPALGSEGLDTIDAPYGLKPSSSEAPNGDTLAFTLGGSSYSNQNRNEPSDRTKDTTPYVEVRESWLIHADDWTTYRYILQLGRAVPIIDLDYTTDEWQDYHAGTLPICPMSIPRYTEVASFYPRGFAERVVYINREAEFLFADYIQEAKDRARLLGISMPVSSGLDMKAFAINQSKYKLYPYYPHPNAPTAKPDIIGPPNNNQELAGAIGLLTNAQDKVANQSEVLYGGMPGARVESARAMGMAVQSGNTGLAMAGESLAFALSCLFKAQLSYVRYIVEKRGRTDITASVNRLDETLLGIQINPEDNSISLEQFPIPDPRTLRISIRSKDPRTKELIRQQMQEELRQGTLDPISYMILVFREGLDLPILDKTPFYARECAEMENVLLFGDGKTPGDISTLKANSDVDQHVIHYAAHLQLANTLAFKAASDEVRAAILQMIAYHKQELSGPQGSGASIATLMRGQQINPQVSQGMGLPSPNGMSTGNPQIAMR